MSDQQPHLYVGGLSGEVFCATRYIEIDDLRSAVVKFNVQEDFERVARELGWLAPEDVETLKAESADLVTKLLQGERSDSVEDDRREFERRMP